MYKSILRDRIFQIFSSAASSWKKNPARRNYAFRVRPQAELLEDRINLSTILSPLGGGLQILTAGVDTVSLSTANGRLVITDTTAGQTISDTTQKFTIGGAVGNQTATENSLHPGDLKSVTVAGTGTVQLVGNLFSVPSLIDNASISSAVTVGSGQTLTGTGTTGPVVIQDGGNLYSTTAVGTLAVGSLSLQPTTTVNALINGTKNYSRILVTSTGSVHIAGTNLVLSGNAVPANGESFLIVNNAGSQPVSGTFNGLPEGTVIPNFLGSSLSATISYVGGDGNDVVLNVGSAATTATTVTASAGAVTYGTPITFSAAVSASAGTPTGNVEFFDGTTGADLGAGTLVSSGAGSAVWTLATAPTQLGATGSNADRIEAVFSSSTGFFGSVGTLAGGVKVGRFNLTVTGLTVADKTYNHSTQATINAAAATLTGVFSGDAVTLNSAAETGAFASQDVGSAIPVTIAGLALNGLQASNYVVIPPSLTANITPATLTLTGITVNDKIYDGTTSATLKPGRYVLNGLYGADSVTLTTGTVTGTFASKDAGKNVLVNLTGLSISGPQVKDYTLASTATGNITPLHLTLSGLPISAYDKVYDGTTAATLKPVNATLAGVLPGDTVTLAGGTGTFASKDVGSNLHVTVTGLTLGGAQAGDYTAALSAPQQTLAKITPAPLTVAGITADNKLYDGTTSATLYMANPSLIGAVWADDVTLNAVGAVGTFTSKDVGNNIPVLVTGLTITGAQVGDYVLLPTSLAANIELAPPPAPASVPVKNIIFTKFYSPEDLVSLNGTVLFLTSDPVDGPSLWKTDGSAAGTVVVTKLPSLGIDSNLSVAVGNLAYFSAYDNLGNPRLWRTDGTAAGTFQVSTQASVGFEQFNSGTAAVINNIFYFAANDRFNPITTHFELWRTDGTVAGTYMVKDINPATGSHPGTLTNVNGTLYFFADDGLRGEELWKSDGTADGTVLVKDITPGPNGTSFGFTANVNGTLFFTLSVGGGLAQLWRSDGSDAGTYLVYAANSFPLNAVNNLTPANNLLYFTVLTKDRELWRTDGTTAGTFMVKAFPNTTPRDLVNVNGTLFFLGADGVYGIAPWKSDGTPQGTVMIKAINPTVTSFGTNIPASPAVFFNGLYFFVANDGIRGEQLWSSDGTQAGTSIVTGLYQRPGPLFDVNPYLTIAGDKLIFAASDGINGRQLWRLDYAPTVTNHNYLISEGKPLVVEALGLLEGANDRDNDPLTAMLVSGPAHGQVTVSSDGSFTYTPAPGFHGPDSFTYTARDAYTFGNLATVNLITAPGASITYQAGSASMIEPALGATAPYYFTISLNAVPPKPVTVYYQTRNGSAHAGEDYRGVSNYRVTFPAFAHGAGADTPPAQHIAITVNGDAPDGTDPETFTVVLTAAYNATIVADGKSATGTIMQAPLAAPPKVTVADYSMPAPSAGSMVFDVPVTLSDPAAQPITVYYSTTDETAKAGVDYAAQRQGHLTIAAAQTGGVIPITVMADAAAHMNVTFTLNVSYWVNAELVSSSATVTITYPGSAVPVGSDGDPMPIANKANQIPAFLGSGQQEGTAISIDALNQLFAVWGAII